MNIVEEVPGSPTILVSAIRMLVPLIHPGRPGPVGKG